MEEGAPRAPQSVFEAGVPVLGICYGEMAMAHQLGATVEAVTTANSAAPHRHRKASPLLAGLAPSATASRCG